MTTSRLPNGFLAVTELERRFVVGLVVGRKLERPVTIIPARYSCHGNWFLAKTVYQWGGDREDWKNSTFCSVHWTRIVGPDEPVVTVPSMIFGRLPPTHLEVSRHPEHESKCRLHRCRDRCCRSAMSKDD